MAVARVPNKASKHALPTRLRRLTSLLLVPAMSRQFEQRLLGDYIEPITVKGPILETALSQSLIESLVDSSHATVGISPAYNTTGRLVVLAIANATSVLVIQFQNVPQDHHVRVLLRDLLLCRTGVKVYSFDIAPLALALYKDHGLHVDNAIDIQSACRTKTRDPYLSIKYALSDKFEIFESNIRAIFNPESFTWNPKNVLFDLGQRAWIAHYLSQIKDMEHEFQAVAEVHTSKMPRDVSCRVLSSCILLTWGSSIGSHTTREQSV